MHRFRFAAGLGLLLLLAGGAAQSQDRKVSLEVVKYDGLAEAVLRNRGKVVLIDFWGFF